MGGNEHDDKSIALGAPTQDEHEAATIQRALDGDPDAGREALDLCRAALDARSISPRLAAYLADRLVAIDKALDEAERLRQVKASSGSIRAARDAAIAEGLLIKRPASKPPDPFPEWQVKYASLGALLLKAKVRPEAVKAAMDDARRRIEGNDRGLDRRTAERILAAYAPSRAYDDDLHVYWAGPLLEHDRKGQLVHWHWDGQLREILQTYLPQKKTD